MIVKTGIVTITDKEVLVEHFEFADPYRRKLASLDAIAWALKRLQDAHRKESKLVNRPRK